MATYKKVLSGSSAYGATLVLVLTQGTQNVANNSTIVHYNLYLSRDGGNTRAWANGSYARNVKLDGSTVASGSGNYNLNNSSTYALLSGQKTIYHNSNGSKSVPFSASFTGASIHGSATISGTFALDTIPRASSITSFSMAGAITNSSSTQVQLEISRKSTSFTHDITLLDGSTAIASWTGQNIPTSLTVTASQVNTLLGRMSTVTSKTLTLRVQTKSGSNNIGSAVTKTATVSIASSVKPSISGISISEYVSGLNAQFGAYVQGKSRLAISMSSSAGYGSSVRSRSISANGTSYNSNSATTAVLRSSGTMRITFSVTDTRGRTETTTRDVTVVAYSNPYINSLTAERSTSAGVIDDKGTHALVKYNAGVSSVGSKNTKSYVLRYRRNGTTTWTSITLANTNYSYNTSRVIGPLDSDYEYDIQLVVSDYFSSQQANTTAQSTWTLMNFAASKRGVGVGQAYNENLGGGLQLRSGGYINGQPIVFFAEYEEW